MIDQFCNWFEGEFDNWTQAASNPTKWAHIIVKHEKLDDYKYHTSSRYSYMDEPYREQTVEIEYVSPELIIVHNPACDITNCQFFYFCGSGSRKQYEKNLLTVPF